MFRAILNFFGFLFAWGSIGTLMGVAGLWGVIWIYSIGLPDHESLTSYEPTMLSRVYSGEGDLMDEFVRERRVFTPIDEIPDIVKHAFISAEDKNFYDHSGFDPLGIAKAIYDAAQGQRLRGASTITQQVMKNFLLDGGRNAERKIKEIILAVRFETAFSKDQILELYLNEPFLGQNAYGVASAAKIYFNKTLEELTPGEAAYLAALPKAPSDLHPVRQRQRATARRNFVLKEMAENGYLSWDDARAERDKPLITVQSGEVDGPRKEIPPRDYFTEEIRRQLASRFGSDKLMGGGLTIRATIDPEMQAAAVKALRARLESWDRERGGYRGPVSKLDPELLDNEEVWRKVLLARRLPRDIEGWHLAVILELGESSARIGIEGIDDDEDGHFLPITDANWARRVSETGRFGPRPRKPSDIWAVGDVVFIKAIIDNDGTFQRWSLRQIPELQGGFVALDPKTGRVLALQGGFSYQHSVFNRATQATRQPGSSFKPFVYAAALDRGFSPATVVLDAPVEVETGAGIWRPLNASQKFYGPSPMRTGIEQSRNVMTVRIAQDVGMDVIADYAERFGVYKDMPHHLSYSLGAGETTLYKMVAAYGMFANSGLRVEPTLVDRVQDRRGRTIYRHDQRLCEDCDAPDYTGQVEPWVINRAERVMDAVTAYQLTSMMKGVVSRGTAKSLKSLGLNLAGKTGTTNDAKDAWFIGFTPNLVAGCFIGYDQPRPMGKGAFGGTLCGPVVKAFLSDVSEKVTRADFKRPPGTVAVKIDRKSGIRMPDNASGPGIVVEIFRIGEEPSIFGAADYIVGEYTFNYGNDLPLYTDEERGLVDPSVKAADRAPPPPPPKAQLDLGSGGLY